MTHEFQFDQVKLDDHSSEDAIVRPWVIVLSEWNGHEEQVVQRIRALFAKAGPSRGLPTVLIVDDLGGSDEEHRQHLRALTNAGAIVLDPEGDEERVLARNSPLAFVARQLALAGPPHLAGASTAQSPAPGNPDGYREFATAVTRLSAKDLTDVIEGRRSDDWRYEV